MQVNPDFCYLRMNGDTVIRWRMGKSESQGLEPALTPIAVPCDSETDSIYVVTGGRSEEFLFLETEAAPREFAYEISKVTAGTRTELVKGEARFTNNVGQGVRIEAPWVVEANGARRADAVHWELDAAQNGSVPKRLRRVVAAGLRYPAVIDLSWTATGSLATTRYESCKAERARGQS